jgi:hypothetical protein
MLRLTRSMTGRAMAPCHLAVRAVVAYLHAPGFCTHTVSNTQPRAQVISPLVTLNAVKGLEVIVRTVSVVVVVLLCADWYDNNFTFA